MSFVVLAILVGLIVLRPVILRARVPQHPTADAPAQEAQSATAKRMLNGAAGYIVRAAPNKVLPSLR